MMSQSLPKIQQKQSSSVSPRAKTNQGETKAIYSEPIAMTSRGIKGSKSMIRDSNDTNNFKYN